MSHSLIGDLSRTVNELTRARDNKNIIFTTPDRINGASIIFSTQENFNITQFPILYNNGWNNNGTIVPGYTEVQNKTASVNQRGGVWQISIDSNNYFKLNFVQEILPGSYVQVNTGETHSNSFQLYDINAINQGFTQPRYVQTHNAVLQPRVKTTFDKSNTVFINNIDSYTLPLNGDKYLKFPKIGVFTDGQ